eukprot:532357_1
MAILTLLLVVLLGILNVSIVHSDTNKPFILIQQDYELSSKLLYRYIYEISNTHSDIHISKNDQHFIQLHASLQTKYGFIVLPYNKIHLINKHLQPSIINMISLNAKHSPESHSIHFVINNKTTIQALCLGSKYSIFSLLELIGVRFRIHADTIPRKTNTSWSDILYQTSKLHKSNHWFFSPSFSPRGIQPFHAYSEGPDWWNHNDYKMISEQMYKMKMNGMGYHTYPVREALVWYGTKSQFNSDTGNVLQSYPASWITTLGWVGGGENQGGDWGGTAMNTSDYVLGSSLLYPLDCYSSEIQQSISDHLCPYPSSINTSEQNEVFNNAGHLLHDVFGYAKQFGISAIVGTEIPLTIPPITTCQGPICALQDFYSVSRNDHFITATNCAECEGLYTFVTTEGWISTKYDSKIFNITLLTCWNANILDSLIAVGECPNNYIFVRIAGYGSEINQSYNNVQMIPLYMYILSENNVVVDHWTIANITSAKEAIHKGYTTNSSNIIAWVLSEGPNSPYDNNTVLDYYEGIFSRINSSYPIDYYWLWTPENWEWQKVNQSNPIVMESINDILTAYKALNNIGKPFKLGTAGWVLGPLGNRSMFDYYLPKDVIMTSIEMQVGWSEPDPAYGLIKDRETWSIPWMEDDSGLTALQLWVNRTMEHIYLSQEMNVNGLLGLNWRTQEVSPQFSVLASMGWNITNEYGERNMRLLPKTSLDFWLDFVNIEFGLDINENNASGYKLATLLDSIDSFNLPRQSLPRGSDKGLPMFGCPGIIESNKIPWANMSNNYWTWVDQYVSYDQYVNGTENTERFNYWKYMFTYFKMMAKVGCDLGDIENIEKFVLINDTTEMMNNLMASLTTTGTMGTITDTQQKFFPYLSKVTNISVKHLLPQTYSGITRVFVLSPRSIYLINSDDVNEYYDIKVIILSKKAPLIGDIIIYYRSLNENNWNTMNVKQLGINRQVYSAKIQIVQQMVINNGFEYFVEAKADAVT